MTISENPSLLTDEPYQRQMTSYRRTRGAILKGAKSLVASHGFRRANMVDIADIAEVSRATLYNHFRDKSSVMRALLESEVDRIFQLVDSDISPTEALLGISREISSDSALEMMRSTDPAVLTQMLAGVEDPLWQQIHEGLKRLLHNENRSEIARLWLVGQVVQPLTIEQSREQARAITSAIFKF